MASATRWLPLESNPEVMNKFVRNLGVKDEYSFVDVIGLDDDMLCMVAQPVYALLLLFPCSDKYEKFRSEQAEKIKKDGQEVSSNLYYMKQTVHNACGTVAIIHSIANNVTELELEDGDLKTFIETTKGLTADQKAEKLENDQSISTAHEASAQEGQTETPSIDDEVNLHFVALVQKDGCIYELDGRKEFPVNHGKSSPETFLKDGARVCKEFMARDPEELHFTVVALAKA